MELVPSVSRRRTADLRHAVDGERGGLGLQRVAFQRGRVGLGAGVGHFQGLQIPLARQISRIGLRDMGIFRRFLGHRNGALGHRFNGRLGHIRR